MCVSFWKKNDVTQKLGVDVFVGVVVDVLLFGDRFCVFGPKVYVVFRHGRPGDEMLDGKGGIFFVDAWMFQTDM